MRVRESLLLVVLILLFAGCGNDNVEFGMPVTVGERPERENTGATVEGTILASESFRFDTALTSVSFGEGFLWVTDLVPPKDQECDDTGGGLFGSVNSEPVESVACGFTVVNLLDKMDPVTLETVAQPLPKSTYSAAKFGAGSVWLSRTTRKAVRDAVLRLDPETGEVTREIPLQNPGEVVFDRNTVWVVRSSGTVSRIDPASNTVVGETRVSDGYVRDLAVGGGGCVGSEREPRAGREDQLFG